MNKQISAVIVAAALAAPAPALSTDDIADKFFSKTNPTLSEQEKAALAIAKTWNTGAGIQPFAGPNGTVRFVFGAQQPSIVCAVLQVCDVALQAGEQVNSIQLGDTSRWVVEPAISGSGQAEILHVIIKPLDVGLETSLVILTNRRTYHLKLRSHRTEYMSQVSFIYPEEALAKWDTIQRQETQVRKQNIIQTTGEYLGNLSFDYDVEGISPWKPTRVYNDGKKTIIEMPNEMEQTEAPVLLVMRNNDETVMVTYRVHGMRYIVDTVFEKAILIAGVGSTQDRITITRKK